MLGGRRGQVTGSGTGRPRAESSAQRRRPVGRGHRGGSRALTKAGNCATGPPPRLSAAGSSGETRNGVERRPVPPLPAASCLSRPPLPLGSLPKPPRLPLRGRASRSAGAVLLAVPLRTTKLHFSRRSGLKIFFTGGFAPPRCLAACRRPSVDLSLREFLLYGLFASFAVREVEPEVCPLVGRAAVGDGDGVAHAEVHGLHHALPLQLARAADGDGGGVAAGADELLGPVVVALLELLQTSPDDHPVLLRDLQSSEILQGQRC